MAERNKPILVSDSPMGAVHLVNLAGALEEADTRMTARDLAEIVSPTHISGYAVMETGTNIFGVHPHLYKAAAVAIAAHFDRDVQFVGGARPHVPMG